MSWFTDALEIITNPWTIFEVVTSWFEAETEEADIARQEALSKEQIAVAREKLALTEKMWSTELGLSREDMRSLHTQLTPYREAGTDALGKMLGLMENPDSIAETGAYKFLVEEGARARNMRAIATGDTGGALDKELTRFGQGLASQEYGAEWNRLMGLANLGRGAVTPEGGPGTGAGAPGAPGAFDSLGEAAGQAGDTIQDAIKGAFDQQGPGADFTPPSDSGEVGVDYTTPDITTGFWEGLGIENPFEGLNARDLAAGIIPGMDKVDYPVVPFLDDPWGWYQGYGQAPSPYGNLSLDTVPGVPQVTAPSVDPGTPTLGPGMSPYGSPSVDTVPGVPQVDPTEGTGPDAPVSVPALTTEKVSEMIQSALAGYSPNLSGVQGSAQSQSNEALISALSKEMEQLAAQAGDKITAEQIQEIAEGAVAASQPDTSGIQANEQRIADMSREMGQIAARANIRMTAEEAYTIAKSAIANTPTDLSGVRANEAKISELANELSLQAANINQQLSAEQARSIAEDVVTASQKGQVTESQVQSIAEGVVASSQQDISGIQANEALISSLSREMEQIAAQSGMALTADQARTIAEQAVTANQPDLSGVQTGIQANEALISSLSREMEQIAAQSGQQLTTAQIQAIAENVVASTPTDLSGIEAGVSANEARISELTNELSLQAANAGQTLTADQARTIAEDVYASQPADVPAISPYGSPSLDTIAGVPQATAPTPTPTVSTPYGAPTADPALATPQITAPAPTVSTPYGAPTPDPALATPQIAAPTPAIPEISVPTTYGTPTLDTIAGVPQATAPAPAPAPAPINVSADIDAALSGISPYGMPSLDTVSGVSPASISADIDAALSGISPYGAPTADPALTGVSQAGYGPSGTTGQFTYDSEGNITGATVGFPSTPTSFDIPSGSEWGEWGGFPSFDF